MRKLLKANLRWGVVPMALLSMGASGCSKVSLPGLGGMSGVGKGAQTPAAGSAPVRSAEDQAKFERIQKICNELAAANGEVPHRRVAEYPLLKDALRSMSAVIHSDPKVFQVAHERAFREANLTVRRFLLRNKHKVEAMNFSGVVNSMIKEGRIKNNEEDIRYVLEKAMYSEEGSACSDYYLDYFYTLFVRNVDLFGSIVFGSTSTPAVETTLGLSVQAPQNHVSMPPVLDRGNALWINWYHWENGATLDAILTSLDNLAKSPDKRGIVIDLRYAGGNSMPSLAKVRAAARRNWGGLPLILIVNHETRGLSAVMATELASKPNVQVWGEDPVVYGYGRKLKQQAFNLVEGASAVNITVGSELLQPEGDAFDRDGYRLRVREENVRRILMDEMVARAEKFAYSGANEAPADVPIPVPLSDSPQPDAPVEQTSSESGSAPGFDPNANYDPNAGGAVTPEGEVPAPIPQPSPEPAAEPPAGVPLSDSPPTTF